MRTDILVPLALMAPLCSSAQDQLKHKNILLIIADDLRPALGCYGYPQVQTPNIDRLASKGTVFKNAFCNAPVSGASRASLLTGLNPSMPERFSSFDAWASKDAPDAVSLPGWLKANGYATYSYGKVFHNIKDHDEDWSEYPWRLNPDGYGKDWAEYNKWELWLNDESGKHINPKTGRGPFCEISSRPDEDYDDGQVALHAAEKLRELGSQEKPFFLAVGFWKPHLPFNAPEKYWNLYNRDEIMIADNRYRPKGLPKQCSGSGEIKGYALVDNTSSSEFHALARHAYYACVSFVDAQVGKVLNALEESGLADDTVVIFIGDHGWHLGEHNFWGKHNLLHNAVNAPLIIADPSAGKRSPAETSAIAQFVDIYPTICGYAGVKLPESLDGQSLEPIVSGHRKTVNRYAFIHWGNGISVVDGRYNYVSWTDQEGNVTAQMLFDHKTDPGENENVISSPGYTKVAKRLSRILEEFRKSR